MKLTGPTNWSAPPSTVRVDINIRPEVRHRLATFLCFHPEMRGVGYSEFIMRALDMAEAELETQVTPLDE